MKRSFILTEIVSAFLFGLYIVCGVRDFSLAFTLSFGLANLSAVIFYLLELSIDSENLGTNLSTLFRISNLIVGTVSGTLLTLLFVRYISLGRTIVTGDDLKIAFLSLALIVSTIISYVLILKRKYTETLVEVERFRRLALEEKMKSVRSKLGEHFLFNALDSIAELIEENPPLAEKYTVELSHLFRKMLSAPDVWTISEELEFVELYLSVMELKFERLEYSVKIDGVENVKIPALSFQPIIENALRHGVSSEGGGSIDVEVFEEAETITLRVSNTGAKPRPFKIGTGLSITFERLKMLFEVSHDLRFENNVAIFELFMRRRREVEGWDRGGRTTVPQENIEDTGRTRV